ncbi:MAG: hypothetical protein IPM74_18370 [Crocinitomicaceae bacterium]|nr:hypothetical protein [Crocinitomicaceae bacterium]MBK8927809.1 hypothetical protein [Crocinitomicaceae bacterium]
MKFKKLYVRVLLAIIAGFFFCCNNSESLTNEELSEGTAPFDSIFDLHYASIESPYSNVMELWIVRSISKIESFFSKKFLEKFDVFIYSERDSLDKVLALNYNIPNFRSECWLVAIGERLRIDLLSPRVWSSQSCEPGANDTNAIYQIVTHELVHVFHQQHCQNIQRNENMQWFTEGLAVYVSGQLGNVPDTTIKNLLLEADSPESLIDLKNNPYNYNLSGSLVEYIDENYGRNVVFKMISIEDASELLENLKVSEAQLIVEWKESIDN